MGKAEKVSIYGLYGEEKPSDNLGFFHIEKISTRSSLHDWRIKPHAHHGMFQLLFLSVGEARVRVDGTLHTVRAPAVICLPGSVVHGFHFLPATEGWVLTVGEATLTDDPDPRTRALIGELMLGPVLLPLAEAEGPSALMKTLLQQMYDEFNWPHLGHSAMLDWMVRILLVTVRRLREDHTPKEPARQTRRRQFTRFRLLLEDRYKSHWSVARYAESLGMAPARLNRLCRAVTEKTAGLLIQDRLILEAQRLLIYTNATSSMVAYELGFQDPAYFTRFFKRRTGLSPIEFRKQQAQTAP